MTRPRMRLSIASLALISMLVSNACRHSEKPEETVTASALAPSSSASAQALANAAIKPPPSYGEGTVLGPAEGDASREARTTAVLDLISGGDASGLVLEDVASGRAFDPGLGKRLDSLGSTHRQRPSVRLGAVDATGAFPTEVISRIVRMNIGRFRRCYENGLRSQSELMGDVQITFIIGVDGSVAGVRSAGSMPDKNVVSCVKAVFHDLAFPKPEEGLVKVTTSVQFKPD
jgi:hypothetical protein